MSTKRIVAVLMILTAFTSLAAAQCVVRNRNVVAVNTVAAAAVVTPVITPVLTPLYGASYSGEQDVDKLKAELAALQSRVAILETARDNLVARLAVVENKAGIVAPKVDEQPKPQPQAAPRAQEKAAVPVGNLPALYARSCVQCHQQGKKTAGGLALVDATGKQELAQTCEMRLEILRRINLDPADKDAMPPKSKGEPVTDAEASDMMERLTRNTNAAPKK